MKNDYHLFAGFEERGNKILSVLHENALGHNSNKTLRKWNLSEVSELVGRTSHTLIKHINKGHIKKPQSQSNNQRIYSIEDINTIRDYFKTRPSKPIDKEAQIIAFTNFKGGVAKTTSSVHAAHYFARAGYKVLFIDADSQGSGTSSFGYAPDHHFSQEETLLPLFTNFKLDIKTLIKKTYWNGLDLIPANLSLYSVELQAPIIGNKLNAEGKIYPSHAILNNAISKIKNDYDVIIIDCPPSMSFLNTNALYAADGLIIPCPPELPDVASMFQFFEMIKGILKRHPEKAYNFVRILMTKIDGSDMSNLVTQTIRKLYTPYVMHAAMHNTQVIKKARANMKSVYEIEVYSGSKKTLDRAIHIVDEVNKEIELLVKTVWEPINQLSKKVIEEVS